MKNLKNIVLSIFISQNLLNFGYDFKKMPDLKNMESNYSVNLSCYSDKDVKLSLYNLGERNILLATRTGKDKPFALIDDYGVILLDNGIKKGIPEDGEVDEVREWNQDNSGSICYDYPK